MSFALVDDVSVLTESTYTVDTENTKKIVSYDNSEEFDKNIKSMNLIQLKEQCKIKKIKGYSTMNKDELIEELIQNNYKENYEKNIKSMNLIMLKEKCKFNNIKGYSTMNKDTLIEQLLEEFECKTVNIEKNKKENKKKYTKSNDDENKQEENKEYIKNEENSELNTINSEDSKKIPKVPCYNCGGLHYYKKTPCINISKEEFDKQKREQREKDLENELKQIKEQKEKEKELIEKERKEIERTEKERLEKERIEKEKAQKNAIPKSVKKDVWNLYIGSELRYHKCLCCKKVTIENTNFHCGHVISEKNGGTIEISNLRPICSSCNHSMSSEDMIEYVKKYGYYIG